MRGDAPRSVDVQSRPNHEMGKTVHLLLAHQQSPATDSSQHMFRTSALRRYEDGARLLVDLITSGVKAEHDLVWRNTCEWLLQCKVGLYVLAPRHDSSEQVQKAEKAEKRGYDPSLDCAYFGLDKPILPGCAGSALPAYGQVTIIPFAQRRFTEPGKIVIIDPMAIADREQLKRVVAYEVQLVMAHEQPESDLEKYRSEFNARWVAGYHDKKSEKPDHTLPSVMVNNRKVAMRNARQAAIFSDIYNHTDGMPSAWNHWWSGPSFQRSVFNISAAQGKNLINSVRIDNLYGALTAEPLQIAQVNGAVAALNVEDRDAIRNPEKGMVNTWHDILRDADLPSHDRVRIANDLGVYGFSD